MRKLLSALGLMMAFVATGCTLYFGPDDDDDRYYSYCDQSGCWTCDSVTGDCWQDGGGWGCTSDWDCAAGCYCDESSGGCVETGFCNSDADCGPGYTCDDRQSCVPEGGDECWYYGCSWGEYCGPNGDCVPSTTCHTATDCDPGYDCISGTCTPTGCVDDSWCAAGCYCDEESGGCVETGYCTADTDCLAGQICDTDRSTCIPDDSPPTCPELGETDCLNRDDCLTTSTGINCT